MPKFPKDCENANVPNNKKQIIPCKRKGAFLNDSNDFFENHLIVKNNKIEFSVAASKEGKLLMSNTKGLNKKEKTLTIIG